MILPFEVHKATVLGGLLARAFLKCDRQIVLRNVARKSRQRVYCLLESLTSGLIRLLPLLDLVVLFRWYGQFKELSPALGHGGSTAVAAARHQRLALD